MRYLFILLAIFMAGCDQSAAPTPTAAPAPTPEAADVPPAPTHNYVIEDGGEYGYAHPVSANEAANGVAQNSLLMIRYLGEKDGTYTVASYIGGAEARASCKLPCPAIKLESLINGHLVAKEFMPAGGTLISDALSDAITGQLKVYVKPRNHNQG